MKWILRADHLLPLILLAGVSQYAMIAIDVMKSGGTSLWQLTNDDLDSAGILRYVKDCFVVFISCAWLIVLPKLKLPTALIVRIRIYFIWIVGIIFLGTLGFLFGYSPFTFLPAGLRWILLLHASFGVFILSSSLVTGLQHHKFIFRCLWLFLLIDTYAVILQFITASNLLDLAFGNSRLTGLFSNAGVAAFFSIAIALISFQLDGVSLKKRMIITLLSIFLALSSGTRFASTAVFIILLTQMWELTETINIKRRFQIKIMFVPMVLLAIFFGYQALVKQVDRGDAITQQLEKGGRVANFFEFVELLSTADLGELLVGRGLGIGTNTAIAKNIAEGIDPNLYRFNRLTDNALITSIFQFGLIGATLFWTGIYKFIIFVKPKYSKTAKNRYNCIIIIILLTLMAGSPLEHYFLMMSYATSLGAVYWKDQFAKKLRPA